MTTNEVLDGDQLRARSWDQYIGQDKIKSRLNIQIKAAISGFRNLPHVLLAGDPGYGKTTLAQIIARELNDDLIELTMPIKAGVLEKILKEWEGGVLFLDEIHRATPKQQEDLLTLLHDGYVQLPNGDRLYHDRVTVIAATTEPEKIISTLYDRFDIKPTFAQYSDDEMAQITIGMAKKLNLDLPEALAFELGTATGGTPRKAKQFIYAARDLAEIGESVTLEAILDLCAMDIDGLTEAHLAYLVGLQELGGTAGLDKIANMTRLHVGIISNLERLLVKRGFVAYTSSGREITQAGTHKVRGTKPGAKNFRSRAAA